MASSTVYVRVVITNRRAVRALEYVADVLLDAAESAPWNEELHKAAALMHKALRCLRLKRVKRR
jgi:hypothetical protein